MSKVRVAIGLRVGDGGGPDQHIIGIQSHSQHNIVQFYGLTGRALRMHAPSLVAAYRGMVERRGLKRFDVVHSHVDSWFTSLCSSARGPETLWVHTYHTMYFPEDYNTGLRDWQVEINNTLVKKASGANVRICVSRWFQKHLREEFGIDTEYIPNGVDFTITSKASPNRFLNRWKMRRGFVLFVGGNDPLKNPGLFVDLASRIKDERFVMIGRGLDRQWLSSISRSRDTSNVETIGWIHHDQILDAIAASKFVVITSNREGLPTLALEAAALKKLIVLPNHTGPQEIAADYEGAIPYLHPSLDDLEEKALLANDRLDSGVSLKNDGILEKYDWRNVITRIDEIYARTKGR